MKTTWTILLLSLLALTSCRTLRTPDGFASFLSEHSLRIEQFESSPHDYGYAARFGVVGVNDTNVLLKGFMFLENPTQREAYELEQARGREQEQERQQERERAAKREAQPTDTDLFLRLFLLECRGWITYATPLNSDRCRARFPEYTFYSVGCVKPPSMVPVFIAQPLVISTNVNQDVLSAVYVLSNPQAVAKFISDRKRPVATLEEAREILALFEELQNWKRCTGMPGDLSRWHPSRYERQPSRWAYREEGTDAGWTFTLVFLTDPAIHSYHEYRIDVFRDGTVTVTKVRDMGSAGGYG